jgi:hypothetical protein
MRLVHLLKHHRVPFLRTPGSPEIRLECPQCRQEGLKVDNPRLFFNPSKRVGHCFRCGWGGKEHELIKLFQLKDATAIAITFDDPPPPRTSKRVCPVPAEVVPAYSHPRARRYLKGRHLSVRDMQKFALLYCPKGESYWQDRVIAPVFDRHANYRTFVSRSLDPLALKRYLYPKGSTMGSLLYNLHFQPQGATVWLTEGIFDALHCYPYGVASFGKNLSDMQVLQLRLHKVFQVVLLYDAECWQKTPELWERALSKLRKHFFTFAVKLPRDTPTEFSLSELEKMCAQATRL